MEGGLLSTDEFVDWSRDHVPFLHVTSRVEGEPYPDLLRDKGFGLFPSIAFLDGAGDLIAKHSGPRDLEGLTRTAAEAEDYLALRTAAATGDSTAVARLAVRDLALGRWDYVEGQLRLDAVRAHLSADEIDSANSALIDIQYDALASALSARASEWSREEYGMRHEQLAELFWQARRIPSGRLGAAVLRSVLSGAERAADRERFGAALAEFKARYGDQDAYARRIRDYEQTLERL